MNKAQKMAWLFVITISVAVLLTGGAVGIFYFKFGLPKALAGLGFLGITGFGGLGPLIFRKDKGKVEFDERDQLINYRAVLGAYSVFWIVFTAACMIPWFIIGPSGSISVNVLPLMLCGIGITLTLIHSLAILIQYGRTGKGEKS